MTAALTGVDRLYLAAGSEAARAVVELAVQSRNRADRRVDLSQQRCRGGGSGRPGHVVGCCASRAGSRVRTEHGVDPLAGTASSCSMRWPGPTPSEPKGSYGRRTAWQPYAPLDLDDIAAVAARVLSG